MKTVVHKNSTRKGSYGFEIIMKRGIEEKAIYAGTSPDLAKASYWQGIQVGCFLRFSGSIRMVVAIAKRPCGGFTTELREGKPNSLHLADGDCARWTEGPWSRSRSAEKALATIPGMPGPVPSRVLIRCTSQSLRL